MTDVIKTLTTAQADYLLSTNTLKDIFGKSYDNPKKQWTDDLSTTVVGKEIVGGKEKSIHEPLQLRENSEMLVTDVDGKSSFCEDNIREVLTELVQPQINALHESTERKAVLLKSAVDKLVDRCKTKSNGFKQVTIRPSESYTLLMREIAKRVVEQLDETVITSEAKAMLLQTIDNPKAKL